MPRSARIHFPDGLFHIISRAIDRRYLFDGEAERRRYVELLGAGLKYSDARVLAWCIMSNHVHLVIHAGQQPLSRFMKSVHVGYASWKNRRDGRIGPVFAERYKAILVDADEYLLELVRYVHLNPVRAGLTEHPRDSSWSSTRAYLGLERPPVWLDTGTVLGLFNDEPGAARQAFEEFLEDGVEGERSPLLSGDAARDVSRELAPGFGTARRPSDAILGSEAFVESVMEKLGERAAVASLRRREAVARKRPPADRLADLCCEVLGVDREAFDVMPRARGPRFARYLLVRTWVSVYRGRQIDLARALRVNSEQISRWLARSLDHGDELLKPYEALLERLDGLEAKLAAADERVRGIKPRDGNEKRERVSVNLEMLED